MKLRATTIDKMIAKAKTLWGLDDWEITWKFGELPHQGEIDMTSWIEKRSVITIDEAFVHKEARIDVFRLVVHEVGHIVLEPIERGVMDWVAHYGIDEKHLPIFQEMLNTRENEVLGFVMTKVMGI